MGQNPYDRVKLARDNSRPTGLDYIKNIFQGFFLCNLLHGVCVRTPSQHPPVRYAAYF